MKRFVAGLLLGTMTPALASDVVVDCRPIAVPSCAHNALANHFQFQGRVPTRCKEPA